MDKDLHGATRALEALGDPAGALAVFGAILALSCLGTVAGIMGRKLAVLAGIAAVAALLLVFHLHLPLPASLQAEILLLKARIGL